MAYAKTIPLYNLISGFKVAQSVGASCASQVSIIVAYYGANSHPLYQGKREDGRGGSFPFKTIQ